MTKKDFNRREFLKLSAASGTMFALNPIAQAANTIDSKAQVQPKKTLISGGLVISLSNSIPSFQYGDVLVVGDRISAIGPNLHANGASRIDASGFVVMPGLVNAHLHCWQAPLRGISVNYTLTDYLVKILGELGPRFTPNDLYWSTLATALDQIDAGVTTILDWCHNCPTLAHAEAALSALHDAGIRALFLRNTFSDQNDPWSEVNIPIDSKGLLTKGMWILGPLFTPVEQVRSELNLAKQRDQIVSMHWAGPYDQDAFRRLAAEGLITHKVNVVHCNGMADQELQALISSNATFSIAPEIEMAMGFSRSVSTRLLANGVRPSLGIDSETGVSSEMFEVVRFALQLQRYVNNQDSYGSNGKPMDSVKPTALDTLQWATIEGARTVGLTEQIGTLEPGKSADIILVRVPDVDISLCRAGLVDPVQLIISRASATNIDTVMVGGRLKKKSGERLGIPDGEIRDKLSEISRRILSVSY